MFRIVCQHGHWIDIVAYQVSERWILFVGNSLDDATAYFDCLFDLVLSTTLILYTD